MPKAFFEQAADALRGFLPRELRNFRSQVGGHNLKVWFGDDAHEHYEVQALSRSALTAGKIKRPGPALEIGFHSEHSAEEKNEAALDRLLDGEKAWRKTLGKEPEAGRFAGRQSAWRRLSEMWDAGDLSEDGAAIEAAERLAAYVKAFEGVRRR